MSTIITRGFGQSQQGIITQGYGRSIEAIVEEAISPIAVIHQRRGGTKQRKKKNNEEILDVIEYTIEAKLLEINNNPHFLPIQNKIKKAISKERPDLRVESVLINQKENNQDIVIKVELISVNKKK